MALLAASAGCGDGGQAAPDARPRHAWDARLRTHHCARPPLFGHVCVTQAVRLASARDADVMDRHATQARVAVPVGAVDSTASPLWWLAEGGRPADAELFIRRAAEQPWPNYEDPAFAAWYGVARHAATNPAAAAQLARLPDKIGPFQRGRLTMMLALVNDTAARDALRRLRATEGFPPHLAAIADSVLAWPAQSMPRTSAAGASVGAGRWPCSADERPGRTSSGAFGCVADTARTLVVGSATARDVVRLTTTDGGGAGTIDVTAEGASPFADGEAAVTIAVAGSHGRSSLVHLPLSVAEPWLRTVESLTSANRLPWMLLRTMDDPPARVLAGGVSDAAAQRITLRKLTPWRRPWEVAILDDRAGGAPAASLRLTRAQLDAFARALRRAVEAAQEDARRGPWTEL